MTEPIHARLDREAAELRANGDRRISESFINGIEFAATIAYRMSQKDAEPEWEDVDVSALGVNNWLSGEEVEVIHRGTVDGWDCYASSFTFKETGLQLHSCRGAVTVRRRGLYNEFLKPELDKHRKVFEVLGDRTKCAPDPDQISGLGFSSTSGATVTAKVTAGNRQRLLSLHF